MAAEDIDEELRLLDFKLSQLKRDYDQYFLGARPREPVQLRGEINKTMARLSNTAIKRTAARFKFSSLCSRFQALRRQWDETLRKIEAGTYERHRFKARAGDDDSAHGGGAGAEAARRDDLYESYLDARRACGESIKGITRDKLDQLLERQRRDLRAKFGENTDFRFRIAIEDGKVRLKASRVKGAR